MPTALGLGKRPIRGLCAYAHESGASREKRRQGALRHGKAVRLEERIIMHARQSLTFWHSLCIALAVFDEHKALLACYALNKMPIATMFNRLLNIFKYLSAVIISLKW